jgi:PAS domain S-box-containing protein
MELTTTDYSSLFFLSPFPKWVYEVSTLQILDANEAAVLHYGYSREEFRQLTIRDLRPKDEIPKMAAALADIDSKKGNIFFGIFSHQKKSGEKIRMKINGHKVDFQGRKCLLVVGQDVTEEERNALVIKESEERLKSASSIAKLGYWRQDLVTDTLTWSDEIYKIWEKDRSSFEVSFDNFYESIHPDDKNEFKARQHVTFETGKDLDFVHRIVLPDGRIKWVHELGRLIKNPSGQSVVLEGTIQDITSQKETERHLSKITEQLVESEAKFRTIFEIASLGIAQVDPATGQILLVNSFYETITGFSKSELLDMNFVELTHPEDRKKDWDLFRKALHGEVEYRNEKRYVRKDGTPVWVRLHVAFIRDEEGLPIRTVAICEDISIRKKEERLLKLLESVVINTSDAVMITEAEPVTAPGPHIVYVNKAFTLMTGYSAKEVLGKSPRILQGPKSDKKELARLGAALRNWEPCEITVINYKKNGEEYWVNLSVKPVANEKGWFTHWISIERDVTEKKQEELETIFLTQVSQIFNEEPKLADACRKLCEAFADFGDFDFAEIWTPNLEHTHIQVLSACYHSDQAQEFCKRSQGLSTLRFGEGLPGLLWASNKPKILNLSDPTDNFIRTKIAFEAGIKSVFGLPLFFSEKLVGVLIFGTSNDPTHLHRSKNLFHRLETFLGSEINRKSLETNLQHLFEAISYIICQSDLQGRFIRMNKAGCDLLGYREDEIIGHHFDKFVHPEDLAISYKVFKKLGQGETVFDFESRFLTKSGEIIWLSWNCNSDVEEGLVYASAKDISKEKKLNQLHSQASSLARIGSWEVDLLKNQLIWTPIVHQLHETDPENFLPDLETTIHFYREDFREPVRKHIYDCISEGKPFNFEAVLITAKNNERWVRAIGNAEYLEGRCIRIYGSFQDIHDRKEAENRHQIFTSNLPGVVFQYVIKPDGKNELRFVSNGAKEIWGFSAEESERDNQLIWNQIQAGGDLEAVQASIADSMQNSSKWQASWRYLKPTGELRIHSSQGIPEFLVDGTIILNSMILDVTEERKNEELLRQTTSMAKIGSWELDLINQDDDAMYWSPMTREILEVGEDYNPTLSGGFEFYTEESKKQIQKAVELLIKQGQEFDEELLIISGRGNSRWIRCIGKSERLEGNPIKIFGSFQDINNQKTNEIELQKSLRTIGDYKFALDQAAIIAITDARGIITFVNENFCKISKYSEEEILGNSHRLINSKHHSKEFFEDLWKTVSTGNVWRGEIKNLAKDGTYYWVDTTIVPFLDDKNKPIQYLAIRFGITDRKIADERVIKTLEEKKNIIESIADAFFTMDRNFIVSYWNKAAEEMIGVARESLLGKSLWEVFPNAVSLPSYANYHKVLKTGQPITFEDNYGVWLEINAYPSEEGLTVFFRDISIRKEADQRLLQALEEKNSILESIGDAFFSLTPEWRVTYWNKEAEIVLGKKREEILGKYLWEEYADAIDSDFYRQYHKSLETQKTSSFEEYYPTLDKWFEVSVYPSSTGLSVYFKDVTLRKQADIRLLQANERFEKATEATNDAIWDWDIEKNTFFRSKGIEKFFGKQTSRSLAEEDFWQDAFHVDDLPAVRQSIQSTLQNPEVSRWEMEYRIVRNTGEIVYVVDKGVIVRNQQGKAVRMVGAMTDVSERKKHEAELIKLNESLKKYAHQLELTNEELEQFAFIASHDLQEPLRMITSFLDQLKRKYGGQLDSRAHEYIHFATDGAKRMKQIILDLLEYSRAGKIQENHSKISLEQLIHDYKSLRKRIIEEKSVQIDHSALPVVDGYRAPLTQVLHCLLDNAIKYTSEGTSPRIQLQVVETSTEWTISVRDNGLGIAPEFFEKIFVIFQRLHNRSQHSGSGIGLSIVKKQVESSGGEVWLESSVGTGSVFYFTIPKRINPS